MQIRQLKYSNDFPVTVNLAAKSLVSFYFLLPVLLLISGNTQAASFDFGAKAGFEDFVWEEFDDDGSRLLEESGSRFAISGFLGNTTRVRRDFIYRAEVKFYFGTVDYDGQTQDGVPAESDTSYFGQMIEGETGYRAGNASGTFAWDFIGKAGFDYWTREIDNTTDAIGRAVSGGTEEYTIFNIRLGTGPNWQVGPWEGRFIAGLKYPFWTNEFISQDDSGFDDDITLRPKGRVSTFLNFYNYVRLSDTVILTFDAFYDSYRFDKSDSESTSRNGTPYEVWQPESSQDNFGLQGGVSISF